PASGQHSRPAVSEPRAGSNGRNGPLEKQNEEQVATQRDCAKERSVVLLHVGARPVGRRAVANRRGMRRQAGDAEPDLGGKQRRRKTRFRGRASLCLRGKILAW